MLGRQVGGVTVVARGARKASRADPRIGHVDQIRCVVFDLEVSVQIPRDWCPLVTTGMALEALERRIDARSATAGMAGTLLASRVPVRTGDIGPGLIRTMASGSGIGAAKFGGGDVVAGGREAVIAAVSIRLCSVTTAAERGAHILSRRAQCVARLDQAARCHGLKRDSAGQGHCDARVLAGAVLRMGNRR